MNDQITVLVEHCTMQIKLDPFFDRKTTLAKQKQLLGYVFKEFWRNDEAILTLDTYMPHKKAEAIAAWAAASNRYRDEYVCTEFRYDLTAQQKRSIETENRKRLNEVKRCKTEYERLCKISAHYEMLKIKNHV